MGKTFAYGATGPRGLLGDKKMIVITSRGGGYANGRPGRSLIFRNPTCVTFSDSFVLRM